MLDTTDGFWAILWDTIFAFFKHLGFWYKKSLYFNKCMNNTQRSLTIFRLTSLLSQYMSPRIIPNSRFHPIPHQASSTTWAAYTSTLWPYTISTHQDAYQQPEALPCLFRRIHTREPSRTSLRYLRRNRPQFSERRIPPAEPKRQVRMQARAQGRP